MVELGVGAGADEVEETRVGVVGREEDLRVVEAPESDLVCAFSIGWEGAGISETAAGSEVGVGSSVFFVSSAGITSAFFVSFAGAMGSSFGAWTMADSLGGVGAEVTMTGTSGATAGSSSASGLASSLVSSFAPSNALPTPTNAPTASSSETTLLGSMVQFSLAYTGTMVMGMIGATVDSLV